MRLEGAIFDMDGTLLDSMSVWQALASTLLRELGREPEADLDEKMKVMSLEQAADYCRQQYDLPMNREEIIQQINQRVDHFYREEVVAKPGVDKLLSLFKMEGVWLYVATATSRPQAEAALRRTGLIDYFRGIMTCTEAGHGKDSPVIFEKCLTRLRCRKGQCVVFEDALHAIQTAKSAGFRVAGVYDDASQADQEEIQKLSDYYIRSYDEFIQHNAQ